MKRRIWTALVGLAAVVALVAVPSALAAYTSTKLEVQQSGTKLVAKISANPSDDPTARAIVLVPSGTQLTTSQAPGTVLGSVQAGATVLALGGANVQLTGKIVVVAPGQVPASQSAPCLQGATPLATWFMALQAVGQTINFPLYLVSTAGGPFAAVSPAYVLVCLPAPDTPEALASTNPAATAKLYSATLSISGVFSAVPLGVWISIWTPYTPKTGQPNAAGTIAAPAAVAPGAVSASAKKRDLGAIVSGKVTQAGQGRGSATVTIRGGAKPSALRKVGSVKAKANGAFDFRARRGTFFKVTAVAASIAAPQLCSAISSQLQGLPCVNPTANGFTAQSKTVKKK
jgi:hypothetical protein